MGNQVRVAEKQGHAVSGGSTGFFAPRGMLGAGAIGMLLASAFLLAACFPRPDSMQVREGADPFHQDEDVAFRTTYYFRSFDYCENYHQAKGTKGYQQVIPDSDTLYRFIMTGKASTLLNTIHFESGTLKSYEIDPFGANIEFDQDSGRFHFQSRQSLEAEISRNQRIGDYKRAIDELKGLLASDEVKENQNLKSKIENILATTVENYAREITGVDTGEESGANIFDVSVKETPADSSTNPPTPATLKVETNINRTEPNIFEESPAGVWTKKDTDDQGRSLMAPVDARGNLDCPVNSAPARRGFQIMGPEGWRTFDQDERLIMAMSTDAAPLIGTLQELSGRILNAKSSAAALSQPILLERLKISKAQRALDGVAESTDPKAIATAVNKGFDE